MRIFSHKICCDLPEARLVASKFLKIVLGGTAALHAYRVWGAVIFWGNPNDERRRDDRRRISG
jgi:hypothetical protein